MSVKRRPRSSFGQQFVDQKDRRKPEPVWVHPRLVRVHAAGNTLSLTIRTRVGQTVDDLEQAAGPLASAVEAVSWRLRPVSPSTLALTLVMNEVLGAAQLADPPRPPGRRNAVDWAATVTEIRLGRRQDGTPWQLRLLGRHTLVVGCSGSGKGSVLWGVCGGLAPAVAADAVRLWAIDLKKGLEVGMGRDLFHATATTPDEALPLLRELLDVVDVRGNTMAGVSRLHHPSTGDPLHVLVIDELADLIAYAEPTIKADANRLLSRILTQGRALGVVVVACVQDPRKETVTMRGLFTQTVALRLRSAEETRMVLGEGTAALAPAHRIDPSAQGIAWVVEDDGQLDRVRADYWSDETIRATARTFPAAARRASPPVQEQDAAVASAGPAPRQRKPRAPRARLDGPTSGGPPDEGNQGWVA